MRAYLTKPRLFYVLTILNIDIHFGSTQYICTADEFDCGRHCIPKDLVCDGNRDCIYAQRPDFEIHFLSSAQANI